MRIHLSGVSGVKFVKVAIEFTYLAMDTFKWYSRFQWEGRWIGRAGRRIERSDRSKGIPTEEEWHFRNAIIGSALKIRAHILSSARQAVVEPSYLKFK